MFNTQRIGVLVLSLVFLVCVPLHILSINVPGDHAHAHHSSDTTVQQIFQHFSDMGNAPLATFVVLIVVVIVLWFLRFKYDYRMTPRSLRLGLAELSFFDTDGLYAWIAIHHTSPPQIV